MTTAVINHEARAHAYLSCSSSDRWLECTLAPSLEAGFPDSSSPFAAEGTTAHELGEKTLISGKNTHDIKGNYPHDMREFVQNYVDYVRAIPGKLLVEQRLDISAWVPECFGTSDTVILKDGACHIVDLKYGKGIRVDADQNTQLMLYALGAYDEYDCIYGPITSITIHIAQPRLDQYSSWTISTDDLLAWGELIKPIAAQAFNGEGQAKAGEHCRFCKAKNTCRARADEMLATAADLPKGDHLSDLELAALYPKLSEIGKWANDLESYCLSRAESGVKMVGLKLVEGRSNRTWSDDTEVKAALEAAGFDQEDYITTKLQGITAVEKLVGKKEFAELLGHLTTKPPGKPTLVSIEDKRPEISNHDMAVSELLSS